MRSEPADGRPVAIVGGGFSGVMTAAQLAARGVRSLLIDGSGRRGKGVAYSTREPAHILNVISAKMSAWPDRPNDFADWLGDDGTAFAERRAFGRYLAEQLAGAPQVTTIDAMVRGAERSGNGWKLALSDGRVIDASVLILANGNQPPAPYPGSDRLPSELFVNDPWSEAARRAVDRAASGNLDVLILGTGLTMVDVVLSLAAAGHGGRITAVSRRGLIPRAHLHPPLSLDPVKLDDVPLGSVMALWRWPRARSAKVGFRAAVDSLRPHSHAIWGSLAVPERRRFLRHARPWWDVHRHRIAPEVARQIKELISSGRLEIVAGRTHGIDADGEKLKVVIDRRGGGASVHRFDVSFNCTGPLGDISRTEDPLLRQLLDDGEVRADPLSIALEVDETNRAGPGLWALGPLTKGMYWEMVAVPDIRHQAEAVASDIHKELSAHG